MFEPPIFGRHGLQIAIDPQRVRIFHLAKSVKVELSNEGCEFIVFEELGDDGGFKEVSIPDDECQSIVGPLLVIIYCIGSGVCKE